MSNYIKIPLALNPSRAFKAAITIAGDRLEWESTVGDVGDGTVSGTAATTSTPSGAGATFSGIATDTNLEDLTLTLVSAGDDYEVGDVVVVAADTTATGQTTWDEPIKFTITAADLIAIESQQEAFEMIPLDNVICVQNIEQGSATVADKLFIATNIPSGSTTQAQSEFSGWTISFDDDDYDAPNAMASICEAIAKADAAINSQPTVEFFGGVEVISIAYGANPST